MVAEKSARELYLQFVPNKEIARITGAPLDVVLRWISRGDWKNEKDAIIADDLARVRSSLVEYVDTCAQLTKNSVIMIAERVAELRAMGESLTLEEMKVLSSIVKDIDTIVRLEQGKPTEIRVSEFNHDRVIELMRDTQEVDPFMDYFVVPPKTRATPEVSSGDTERPKLLGSVQGEVEVVAQEVATTPLPDPSAESDLQRE